MVTRQAVEEQLRRIGFNFRFWGRSEVAELNRILMDDEIIAQAVNGQYANGFAMLVATNHRVLLVDKKPLLYLTVEDLRFDMITEFNYNHRLLDATIRIFTTNKTLVFTSWNQVRLRKLLEFTQAHVLQMRQQQHLAQQFQAAAAAQYAQLHAAQSLTAVPAPDYGPGLAAPAVAGQVPAQVEPINSTPIAAPAPTPAIGDSTPAAAVNDQSGSLTARIANKRATLGTYTRSKLPSFHRRVAEGPAPESGEVYPAGYTPPANLPYEYEV